MRHFLRILFSLFTILYCTTIAGAAVQEMHTRVAFEKACVLEGETSFSAEFVAANSTVPQVLRNQTQGALGEAAVRARLLNINRLDLVGEQIRITTPGVGSFRVTDFMVQSRQTGRLSIIEVKTGGATCDATQLAKDALIADPFSPTIFTGSRAGAAGFPSGIPTGPIRTFEVNASNLKR